MVVSLIDREKMIHISLYFIECSSKVSEFAHWKYRSKILKHIAHKTHDYIETEKIIKDNRLEYLAESTTKNFDQLIRK